MKKSPLALAFLLFLSACGGSGGSNNASTDLPTAYIPTDTPAANLSAIAGSSQTGSITLGTLRNPPNRPTPPDAATQAQLDIALAETNRLRAEVGQPPLQYDADLAAYAAVRAQEVSTLFEHTRPNGQSAVDPSLFTGYGLIGENLAAGNNSPQYAVAEQWRNSPSHYAAIINGEFTRIGMGYYYAPLSRYRYHWTQIFGGGTIDSLFSFLNPLSRDAALAAIRQAASYDSAGKLSLAGSAQIRHNDSINHYSASSGLHRNAHYIRINDEHQLVLRPHYQTGWSYQTFGEIADMSGIPEAYVNIGNAFTPAADANFQASYRGKAIGDLGQHSRVLADVSAQVDFGGASKTLSLTLSNAQRANRDLESQQALHFTADSSLNFNDTLHWNSASAQFESASGNARLYGDNAAELGGQFQRTVNAQSYRGAYGASRTQ